MKYLFGFAKFWRSFLIGDSPILFIGTVLTLGIVAVTAKVGITGAVAFPALIMATVAVSLARGEAKN